MSRIDYYVNGSGDPECTSPSDDSEILPMSVVLSGSRSPPSRGFAAFRRDGP